MAEALGFEKDDDWNDVLETLKEIELWDLELQGDFGTQAKYDLKEYERLLKQSYQKLFDAAKSNISTASSIGNIPRTRQLISEMSYYSYVAKKQFGLDMAVTQKEVDDWMKDAFNQGIPDLFNRIFALAQKGQVQTIKRLLPELQADMTDADQKYGLQYQYTRRCWKMFMKPRSSEGIED
jgi:hypothetical protein